MKKKHIISIAGDLASGKGTTSKILMERLNFSIYRNGEYFRKLAKEMNMDVTSFNRYVERHPEIDRQIENSASEHAKNNDNFVIDARLGWYAVPESYKVYLKTLMLLQREHLMIRKEKIQKALLQLKNKKKT